MSVEPLTQEELEQIRTYAMEDYHGGLVIRLLEEHEAAKNSNRVEELKREVTSCFVKIVSRIAGAAYAHPPANGMLGAVLQERDTLYDSLGIEGSER